MSDCICETFNMGSEVLYNNTETGKSFQGNVIRRHACKTDDALTLENNGVKFVVFGQKCHFLSQVN